MSQIFEGSIPYAINVKQLKDAFPVPELAEGRVITHEELEGVTGISRKTQTGRYYGVVNSWISQMKNSNAIFIVWEAKAGIKILDPASILNHVETRVKQKIRQTGRKIKDFVWVPVSRLDSVGQRRHDHDMRVLNALRETTEAARRDLSIELAPVKSLPKPPAVRN